jgi:hypothetical protein
LGVLMQRPRDWSTTRRLPLSHIQAGWAGTKRVVRDLRRAFKRDGQFRNPLVVMRGKAKKQYICIVGNNRLSTLRGLGVTHADCIVVLSVEGVRQALANYDWGFERPKLNVGPRVRDKLS